MRKILLILLFPVFAFATEQSAAKITGLTIGATDSILANANFSMDSSFVCYRFKMPSAQTYTLSQTGTNTVTLQNWTDSSTGTKTCPAFLNLTENFKLSSGSGAVTATSTKVSYSGLLGNWNDCKAITLLQFDLQAGAKVTSGGTGITVVAKTNSPLTMAGNGKLTLNKQMQFKLTGIGKAFDIQATDTIAGSANILFPLGANNIRDTIPYFRTTAIGYIDITDFNGGAARTGDTVIFTGGCDATSLSEFDLYPSTATSNVVYKWVSGTYNLSKWQIGSGAANVRVMDSLGAGIFNIASFVRPVNQPSHFALGSSTINCTGAFGFATLDTVFPMTGTINLSPVVAITVANLKRQLFYNLGLSGAATKKITMGDSTTVLNDQSFTSGRLALGLWDSVGGTWTNTSTDSLVRPAGSVLMIGGNMVSTGTGVRSNEGGAWIGFVGAGKTHNLTAPALTGANCRLGILRILDGGAVNQLSATRALLVNDSSGTWCQNGYPLVIDSLLKIKDSMCNLSTDTLVDSGSVIMGAVARPNLAGYFQMLGTPAATVTGSGTARNFGKVEVKKTATTIVTQTGAIRALSFGLQMGEYRQTNATDTINTDSLNIETGDSAVFIAPIVVHRYLILKAGTKTRFAGTSKIISVPGDTLTITATGHNLPTVKNRSKIIYR